MPKRLQGEKETDLSKLNKIFQDTVKSASLSDDSSIFGKKSDINICFVCQEEITDPFTLECSHQFCEAISFLLFLFIYNSIP